MGLVFGWCLKTAEITQEREGMEEWAGGGVRRREMGEFWLTKALKSQLGLTSTCAQKNRGWQRSKLVSRMSLILFRLTCGPFEINHFVPLSLSALILLSAFLSLVSLPGGWVSWPCVKVSNMHSMTVHPALGKSGPAAFATDRDRERERETKRERA